MAGSGASAESPVVRRMHDAVFELAAAEREFVRFVRKAHSLLSGGDAMLVQELLAEHVTTAREEFDAAFAELQATL